MRNPALPMQLQSILGTHHVAQALRGAGYSALGHTSRASGFKCSQNSIPVPGRAGHKMTDGPVFVHHLNRNKSAIGVQESLDAYAQVLLGRGWKVERQENCLEVTK